MAENVQLPCIILVFFSPVILTLPLTLFSAGSFSGDFSICIETVAEFSKRAQASFGLHMGKDLGCR